MRRITQLGIIGCIAAVALVAHMWMFPMFEGPPAPQLTDMAAPAAAAADAPMMGACPSGMSTCVAASAEELRLPEQITSSALPALLWAVLHIALVVRRQARPSRHGPGPPLSPVQEGVLLLE